MGVQHQMGKVDELLSTYQIEFDPIEAEETRAIVGLWNKAFAKNVKTETGDWICGGFRWHAFSYGYESATSGAEAMSDYLAQWPAEFVIFDEGLIWCYRCRAPQYPDLSSLNSDIYVAHHNMKWTMVFTHEQPDIGPFFARSVPA